MIQPNIRGGICHASVRYARANNNLMGSLYDPTKPTSYIMYMDANNLYGWAMSQPLPDDEYELESNEDCRDAFAHSRIRLLAIGGMIKKSITYSKSTWTTRPSCMSATMTTLSRRKQ